MSRRSVIELITVSILVSLIFLAVIYIYTDPGPINPIDKQQQTVEVDDIKLSLCSIYYLNDWEAKYYAYILQHLADTFKVEWELIAAIIWVESKFNPSAKSNKNAKGVIQMLEATAEAEAKKLKIPYKKNRTVWNPLLQIPLGVSYLSSALEKGGYENAIKTYVGGPNWKKASKENTEKIKQYLSDVSFEHRRLRFQFMGVKHSKNGNAN